MRDIRFRGKAFTEQGSSCLPKWVYGNLIIADNGDTLIKQMFRESGVGYRSTIWQVDPETAGQYTGLKDKNGKEIYDGNVVDQNGRRCIIQSCIGGFCCKMINDVFKGSTFTFDWLHSDYCEIIGNIHDNPELLEGA